MKSYPNKLFWNVIPDTEALKNWQKFEKNSKSFTEIREFFENSIMSKTDKKFIAMSAWPNFYSDHWKIQTFN